MGVSTDGQICFGNVYEEEFEFPWGDNDEGIEGWWRSQNGFVDSIHDEKGDWINGVKPTDEQYREYWKSQREFDAIHPLPVALVNYCSGEYPMWIIAVPSSCRSNSRGEALAFDPSELTVTDAEVEALKEFCVKYELIPAEGPGWYLTSYWG